MSNDREVFLSFMALMNLNKEDGSYKMNTPYHVALIPNDNVLGLHEKYEVPDLGLTLKFDLNGNLLRRAIQRDNEWSVF